MYTELGRTKAKLASKAQREEELMIEIESFRAKLQSSDENYDNLAMVNEMNRTVLLII